MDFLQVSGPLSYHWGCTGSVSAMVFENGLGNFLYFPVLRTLQGLRITTAGLCLNRSRKQASRLHNAGKRHLSLGPEASLFRFGFRWAPLRSRSFRSS